MHEHRPISNQSKSLHTPPQSPNTVKSKLTPHVKGDILPESQRSTMHSVKINLVDGKYQPLEANNQGHLWSQQLDLYLGIHQGLLRFFTLSGQLVPTPEEVAESERQQKELALSRAEKLAAKLRELNIDPDTI